MNPAAQAAAEHLARRADAVVRAAIDKRMGSTDWALDDVKRRVHVVSEPAGETYHLDGQAFLWLGKPKITQDETTGAISVDREWRELV